MPGALSQVRIKFMDSNSYQSLKREFEKRPIWSKNALRVRLDYKKDKLKVGDGWIGKGWNLKGGN